MSDVKMCDNCGELFSVNAEGWRAFEEKWDGNRETFSVFNNSHNHQMIQRHIGPCCALVNKTPTPRIALPKGPENV